MRTFSDMVADYMSPEEIRERLDHQKWCLAHPKLLEKFPMLAFAERAPSKEETQRLYELLESEKK